MAVDERIFHILEDHSFCISTAQLILSRVLARVTSTRQGVSGCWLPPAGPGLVVPPGPPRASSSCTHHPIMHAGRDAPAALQPPATMSCLHASPSHASPSPFTTLASNSPSTTLSEILLHRTTLSMFCSRQQIL
ncbi:hypothetical protein O6H91_09G054000 [Diphasiastrum complanatum]|uniref:Uncharacterized protein n=1 Tax=Diphasiastrum complanatum TaxID=34168 RepID=A0ACC2CP87_DIPCM|nr:hypothetical protein O6H91_09G054000 [Diphasiastrum complanatum]